MPNMFHSLSEDARREVVARFVAELRDLFRRYGLTFLPLDEGQVTLHDPTSPGFREATLLAAMFWGQQVADEITPVDD